MDYVIRRAQTRDVRAIAGLVNQNVASRRLLGKATVTLYEDIQEFWVAERTGDGVVVGCGALHVMWEDLAEIRTVAVHPGCQGHGVGHRLVAALLDSARTVGPGCGAVKQRGIDCGEERRRARLRHVRESAAARRTGKEQVGPGPGHSHEQQPPLLGEIRAVRIRA